MPKIFRLILAFVLIELGLFFYLLVILTGVFLPALLWAYANGRD